MHFIAARAREEFDRKPGTRSPGPKKACEVAGFLKENFPLALNTSQERVDLKTLLLDV